MAKILRRVKRAFRRHGLLGTLKLAVSKAGRKLGRSGSPQVDAFDGGYEVDTVTNTILDDLRIAGENIEFGNKYATIDPSVFEDLLGRIEVDFPGFTFIDIGSGKGRILMLAMQHRFRRL